MIMEQEHKLGSASLWLNVAHLLLIPASLSPPMENIDLNG
jgi:hypothetical protein